MTFSRRSFLGFLGASAAALSTAKLAVAKTVGLDKLEPIQLKVLPSGQEMALLKAQGFVGRWDVVSYNKSGRARAGMPGRAARAVGVSTEDAEDGREFWCLVDGPATATINFGKRQEAKELLLQKPKDFKWRA